MSYDLTTRHYDALETLRFECDYEDGRNDGELIYISRNKLPAGVGEVTLSDLESWKMIEPGTNKWFGTPGYRITDLGRQALDARRPTRQRPKPKHKLKPLGSRLGAPKDRLDR